MRLNKRKRCGSGEIIAGGSGSMPSTTMQANTAYNGTVSSIKSESPNENDPFNQSNNNINNNNKNGVGKPTTNTNVIINYFSNIPQHPNKSQVGEKSMMMSSASTSSLMMPPPAIPPQQPLSRSNSGYLTAACNNTMQPHPVTMYSTFMPPPPPPVQQQSSSTQWTNNFANPYQPPPAYFHPYDLARAMHQQQPASTQQQQQQQQQQQMRLNDISNSSSSAATANKLAAAAAAAAVPMAAAAAAAAAFVTSESFNNMIAAHQKPTNVIPINPYQMYGGSNNSNGSSLSSSSSSTTTSTTFLPSFDPLNTSNLAAKCSSYYCLTPAASTTSLNELNHSLSMNLHLNNHNNNDSLLNMSKKAKTASSLTSSTSSLCSISQTNSTPVITPTPTPTTSKTKSTKTRASQSRTSVSSSSSSTSSIVTPTVIKPEPGSVEPVKRKRGRPRKSIAVVAAAPVIESTAAHKPTVTVTTTQNTHLQRNKSTVSGCYEALLPTRPNRQETAEYSNPLPQLNWAESSELWQEMKKKETIKYRHDWRYIDRHVEIEPHMRAILFDWMIEVCNAYRLHRETLHLAIEYFDRFMTLSKKVIRMDRLQLIGMTSLFIASKVEEIYPPKLKELVAHMDASFVKNPDELEKVISDFEIYMLMTLEWSISPITANTWLLAYLQIAVTKNPAEINSRIHNPHYVMPLNLQQIYQWCATSSGNPSLNNGPFKREQFFLSSYLRSVTLLDLCLLDIEALRFKYSELAAAALYLMMSPPPGESQYSMSNVALRARFVETWTGLKWHEIEQCVNWMMPYAAACRERLTDQKMLVVQQHSSVEPDDAHNIQAYNKYLDLWKEVQKDRMTPQKTSVYQMQDILTPVSNQKCGH